MICTSIQGKSLEEIFAIFEEGLVEMAEIRLDRCPLDDEAIEELFSNTDIPLIATCRIAESPDMQTAERRLRIAIEAGAKYVDVELEAPAPMGKRLRRAARQNGTSLIRSFHDFDKTPELEELVEVVSKCMLFGADVIKIVTTAHTPADAEKIQALYRAEIPSEDGDRAIPEGTLTAFCMGEVGRESRLDALRLGAPFTYASLEEGAETAPGQWSVAEMSRAVYGEGLSGDTRSSDTSSDISSDGISSGDTSGSDTNSSDTRSGETSGGDTSSDGISSGFYRSSEGFYAEHLTMPASKSFAQRAIIAAALAEGTSHLRGYSPCADSEAAIAVARALGAEVTVDEILTIKGIGPVTEPVSFNTLHVGESGLLTRLMIPILAQIGSGSMHITGEKTLVKRPLSGANDIMAAFGVTLRNTEEHPGSKEVFVPLNIVGRLVPGRADISGRGGSQLISGLLMALPLADRPSTLYVSDPKSIPYLFITLDVLQKFGIRIINEMEGDQDFLETQDWNRCTGMSFKIKGCQKLRATDLSLEGDWSSAANFCVAGAVFGSASIDGLDTRSLQADLTIMDLLVEAGASISQIDNECVDSVNAAATAAGVNPHTGAVNIVKAPLNTLCFDLNNAPDLFPIAAVLAAFCPGQNRLGGVARLFGKESNRALAITEMLTRMGVNCAIQGDELLIEGHSLAYRRLNGQLLRGGEYSSHHDHRMVMALKVASLGADSPILIDDEACVAKSFPDFLEIFGN